MPAVAALLARNMAEQGIDCTICTLHESFPTPAEQKLRSMMPVYCLGRKSPHDLRFIFDLRKVIREYQPDIVQSHHYELRYLLPWIMAGSVPPVVFTVHQVMVAGEYRFEQWLYSWVFKLRIVPVAVSSAVARRLSTIIGTPANVIMNGIDTRELLAPNVSRPGWRKAHGFAAGDFLFLTMARFHPVKRIDLMITEFAAIVERHPQARLILVGDGDLRPELEALAVRLRMEGRVTFLGYRNDIAEILNASDAFLLTSAVEGNPMAVMEAMAVGLPVICTAVGGIPELVRSGETGLLVEKEATGKIAAAMERLMNSSELRRTLGQAASLDAARDFDARRMAAQYVELYRGIMNFRGDRIGAEPDSK